MENILFTIVNMQTWAIYCIPLKIKDINKLDKKLKELPLSYDESYLLREIFRHLNEIEKTENVNLILSEAKKALIYTLFMGNSCVEVFTILIENEQGENYIIDVGIGFLYSEEGFKNKAKECRQRLTDMLKLK